MDVCLCPLCAAECQVGIAHCLESGQKGSFHKVEVKISLLVLLIGSSSSILLCREHNLEKNKDAKSTVSKVHKCTNMPSLPSPLHQVKHSQDTHC